MAEEVSFNETPPVKLPPKRRRILDPTAVVPVPIYSNKVNTSLQLRVPALAGAQHTDTAVDCLWTPAPIVILSDSDDDDKRKDEEPITGSERDGVHSPSPPPPQSPAHRPSRKISEINRRLQVVNSLLSPEHQDRGRSQRRCCRTRRQAAAEIITLDDEDTPLDREIPLKIRCRADVHKIHVLPSTPLSSVLSDLSVKLKIPPTRLLLMREEVELPINSTVGELGLGIADIIECAVMAAEEDGSVITVRLQAKDRDSVQEFSLHREAVLGSVFSQYLSLMPVGARKNVRFHFDGGKVTANQTPAQLDMEDGDIIEVWT